MRLDFLLAEQPLTKQYTLKDDGTYDKTPYPNAFEVSSISHEVDTLERFHEALVTHAAENHCLLKGTLTKKLDSESRSGHVDPAAETEWATFDVDGLLGVDSAEEFIQQILPAEFHDVSYIAQHSCSSGISADGLRLHLFFLLETEAPPRTIKRWYQHQNLENPLLADQLSLSKNSMTLKYPLDCTVAENSKLIFIAPPICTNFDDPLDGERIELVRKDKERASFAFDAPDQAVINAGVQKKVAVLRKAAGLPARQANVQVKGSMNLLKNPDQAEVTSWRPQNGYMRVNLNHGDSWAYYYDPTAPKYLHNFKHEPSVELAKIDPEYWANHVVPAQKKAKAVDPRLFAFRDKTLDKYFVGIYDRDRDEIAEINEIAGGARVEEYFDDHGASPPDPVPSVDYLFRPDSDTVFDIESTRFVNRWQPTEYQKKAGKADEIPPMVKRILWSATGSDQEAFDWVVNWLAYIYQTRQKSGVALVLHGTTSTGKGLLFHKILSPIFGEQYCMNKSLSSLTDRYNDYLQESIFVNYNEARIADSGKDSRMINNKLKDWITEARIDLRAMRVSGLNYMNFTNFIFTSNERDALQLSEDDRRFTVCPRQEMQLPQPTPQEMEQLENELQAFASFLNSFEVDAHYATNPLENEAKKLMRLESLNTVEEFAMAFREGDFTYFFEGFRSMASSGDAPLQLQSALKTALKRWLTYVNTDTKCFVTCDELLAAYNFITANRLPTYKFGKLLQHKNIPKSVNGRVPEDPKQGSVKGRYTTWIARKRDLLGVAETLGLEGTGSSDTVVDSTEIFKEVQGT